MIEISLFMAKRGYLEAALAGSTKGPVGPVGTHYSYGEEKRYEVAFPLRGRKMERSNGNPMNPYYIRNYV